MGPTRFLKASYCDNGPDLDREIYGPSVFKRALYFSLISTSLMQVFQTPQKPIVSCSSSFLGAVLPPLVGTTELRVTFCRSRDIPGFTLQTYCSFYLE